MFRRKNIFDILNEAEEDKTSASTDETETSSNGNEQENEEDTTSSDNTEEENPEDNESDDDFDIDTDLDAGDSEGENDSSGDEFDMDSDSSDSESSDTSSTADTEEEPVQANTDIFSSLTAEEQQIKIKELKKLYNDLYCSCDDLTEKINDINTDQDNLELVTRVSMTMYSLKQYISDYVSNVFASKSYIENDVQFNRFLSIVKSVTSIINDLNTKDDKK